MVTESCWTTQGFLWERGVCRRDRCFFLLVSNLKFLLPVDIKLPSSLRSSVCKVVTKVMMLKGSWSHPAEKFRIRSLRACFEEAFGYLAKWDNQNDEVCVLHKLSNFIASFSQLLQFRLGVKKIKRETSGGVFNRRELTSNMKIQHVKCRRNVCRRSSRYGSTLSFNVILTPCVPEDFHWLLATLCGTCDCAVYVRARPVSPFFLNLGQRNDVVRQVCARSRMLFLFYFCFILYVFQWVKSREVYARCFVFFLQVLVITIPC